MKKPKLKYSTIICLSDINTELKYWPIKTNACIWTFRTIKIIASVTLKDLLILSWVHQQYRRQNHKCCGYWHGCTGAFQSLLIGLIYSVVHHHLLIVARWVPWGLGGGVGPSDSPRLGGWSAWRRGWGLPADAPPEARAGVTYVCDSLRGDGDFTGGPSSSGQPRRGLSLA